MPLYRMAFILITSFPSVFFSRYTPVACVPLFIDISSILELFFPVFSQLSFAIFNVIRRSSHLARSFKFLPSKVVILSWLSHIWGFETCQDKCPKSSHLLAYKSPRKSMFLSILKWIEIWCSPSFEGAFLLFWFVMPCGIQINTNVSEEHTSSISMA
jgi:hypothetical protein